MPTQREPHLLERELSLLVRRDSAIFGLLQDTVLDGVWYRDLEHPDHEYRDARFWRALGLDPSDPAVREELTSAWQDRLLPEDHERVRRSLGVHLDDPARPFDEVLRYRHRDGSTVWMRCRGVAIRDESGRPVRMVGAHHDVSELVRAEREARAGADDLRRTQDAARVAELARGQFLSYLGHELRTPLSAAIGLGEAALRGDPGEGQRERLRQSLDASETLLRIVEDAVELAGIEAGEIELALAPFSPRALLDESLLPLRPLAESRGVALRVEVGDAVPRVLVGDGPRFARVVTELTCDALQASDRGEVVLHLDCGAGQVRVPVHLKLRDHAREPLPPIPRSLHECFEAADRGRAPRPGQRLGLALCRRLVQMMGGTLHAGPAPGGGRLFEVEVLLARPARGEEPRREDGRRDEVYAEGPAHGLDILLAEDTESSRKVVLAMLQDTPHRVTLAGDGREALERLGERDFDLVLMDLEMPELDGWETTRAIRTRERATARPRVPIIALTAHALSGTRDACLAEGMDDYLSKPVRLDHLRSAIGRAARARESREAAG